MINGLVSNDVPVIEVVISMCNGDGVECKKGRKTERKQKKKKASGRNAKQYSCYMFFILITGWHKENVFPVLHGVKLSLGENNRDWWYLRT
jgi:hypothetical protein